MRSPAGEGAASDERWLLAACAAELRAHRLTFLFVLCPLLGYWLPSLMFRVGLEVALGAQASSAGREGADPSWLAMATVAAFVAPAPFLAWGAWRDRRRLDLEDGKADSGMALPAALGEKLTARIRSLWADLQGRRDLPRVICQPNFGIAAHAYDDERGQAIEVSAGLAGRVVRDDPLALSILRHEMAHLAFGDIPAIRTQSIVAAAAVASTDASLAICGVSAAVIVLLTDIGTFPMDPTPWHVVAVHLAIVLGALNVALPLLLGRYVVRRYAGFLVALAEMRADVSAGIWGDGLVAFSRRLGEDPKVKAPSAGDFGLAYLSPTLIHFPARERIALLASPGRLATPKLRYFALAIVTVWLMAFHQGQEVWDALLLAIAVAFLQALTTGMLLESGRYGQPGFGRAAALALGLAAVQALPLVSIEGVVYLTQHLTAAIVHPGGFGSADDADYWRDTVETFQEFAGFVAAAVGGAAFPLGVALTAAAFWSAPRLAAVLPPRQARATTLAAACAAGSASLLVSYRFFQAALYGPTRDMAFRLLAEPEDGGAVASSPWDAVRAALGHAALNLSEVLNGPPILARAAWLRLAVPGLAAFAVVLASAAVLRRTGPGAKLGTRLGDGRPPPVPKPSAKRSST